MIRNRDEQEEHVNIFRSTFFEYVWPKIKSESAQCVKDECRMRSLMRSNCLCDTDDDDDIEEDTEDDDTKENDIEDDSSLRTPLAERQKLD